ncbi:g2329 [Coccomyxa elongata]
MTGLNAYKLNIKRITVDGQETTFELRPYPEENLPENVLEGNYASPEDATATVADHAFFQYERTLQRECNPELIINLPPPPTSPAQLTDVALTGLSLSDPATSAATEDAAGDRAGQQNGVAGQGSGQKGAGVKDGNGGAAGGGNDEGVRTLLLRVEYELEQPDSGIHFWGAYAHTNNQVRRARAWFPCVDTPNAACPFDMRVSVGAQEIAVATGELRKQTWTSQNRKTFHFTMSHPTPPRHVALAVGPFSVLPGQARAAPASPQQGEEGGEVQPTPAPTIVTHFAPEHLRPQLEHATKVFPLAFNLFETFLGAHFPYRAFHQVFVPAEGCGVEVAVSAGMCIASTDLLFAEDTVEQAVESWLVLVRALARQWFGVWIRPKIPADEWLLEGLAGYLENLFIAKYLGRNELLYRRHKEREAIYWADDGNAPPLYVKGPAGFPWGALHATESLGPGASPRRWKASAVIHMLEQRSGEDNFKRLLSRLVVASCQPATSKGDNPRLLGTYEFLNQIVKAGGKESKHEVSAFHQRWIIGRGCPLLIVGLNYDINNRKRGVIEVALQQRGSHAARAAAEKVAAKEGSSAGFVKVLVKESEGPVEHPVNLGTTWTKLVELKVTSKPAKPKPGRPGRKKKLNAIIEDLEEDGEGAPADGPDTAGEATRLPVEWVRVDPHGESLAAVEVRQPEVMAAAQLERSKDVAAQTAAIAQLVALRPTSYGVVNALRACMQDAATYCRIRVEAALALGQTAGASTAWSGLEHLLRFYRTRVFDANVGLPRPWQFADLSEHYVNQALPLAIAAARDGSGHSFPEAAEALLEHLDHVDNSGNPYSDDNAIAALLDALGNLHLQSPEAMAGIVARLERFLQREAVMPSFHNVVGTTALSSLTRLATSMRSSPEQKARLRLWLQRYSRVDAPHHLRLTAAECSVRLAACTGGPDGAILATVTLIAAEKSPALRPAMLEVLLRVLHSPGAAGGQSGGAAKSGNAAKTGASIPALSRLHALLSAHGDVQLRHLAFMALMRLGGLAPTLFREEEEFANAGPAMSMEGGTQRVGPAPSGAPISFDSGGTRRAPVQKHRSSMLAPTRDTAMRSTLEVSGEAGTQQALGRSSARQRSEHTLVDLTEVSNRAPTVPTLSGMAPAAAAANEQEVVSSPAVPQAGPPALPTKSLKLKFSIGSKRAGQASAGAPSLAPIAAAAAADEPAKRKRDGAAEISSVDEDAAPAKRQKKQGPARARWDPVAGAEVTPRAATPPVHGPEVAIQALARLPSPFAGPADAPWPQPPAQQQPPAAPAGATAKEPKTKAKKGRIPPPAIDPAARKALLEDVMAIAGRSPTPPPTSRQPTPQPRAAEPGSHTAAQTPMPPAPPQQQQKKKKHTKPSNREPLPGAVGPAVQQPAVQAGPQPQPATKPKFKVKFSGSTVAPHQPSSAPALGQQGSSPPQENQEYRSGSRASAPAAGQQQPKGSDAAALPKLKKLKFTFSGKAGVNPGSSTPKMGPGPSSEKGKAGKQPTAEDEKQRRKKAQLLKEQKSLLH